jgi:hypothetical protein
MAIILIFFLALIAIYGIIHYNKSRARFHWANQKEAMRELDNGAPLTPPSSWSNNPDKVDTFFKVLEKAVPHKGVPRSYVSAQVRFDGTREIILAVAGRMEQKGSPYFAQQAACMDFIVAAWLRLAEEHKKKFISLG